MKKYIHALRVFFAGIALAIAVLRTGYPTR
jgi:hypothetical protein